MEMLRSLLKKECISSREDLDRYIEAHYGKKTISPFQILKKDDISLDKENRIYDPKIDYERTIFDVPSIRIANSKSISFKDCIFTGELLINQNIDAISSVYLDYCVFTSALKISSLHKADSVTLQNVNAPIIEIWNSTVNSFSISSSRTAHLLIGQCCIFELRTFSNRLEQLDIYGNSFKSANFSMDQIDISKQPSGSNDKKIRKSIELFNPFTVEVEVNYDHLCNKEEKQKRNDTFGFLKKYSDASLNRALWGELSYRHTLAAQASCLSAFFQRCLGAFIKPKRLAGLTAISILAFSFFYQLPFLQFKISDIDGNSVARSLTWPEAVYYSGISFTTIGYGDIAPIGQARWLSVAEGFVGVFLISSLVVSLTRKYAE